MFSSFRKITSTVSIGQARAAARLFVLIMVLTTMIGLESCAPQDAIRADYSRGAGGPDFTGSGNLVTKQMDLAGFSAVEAQNAFKVDITRSDSFSVSITADDNTFEHLVVQKDGDVLTLGIKPGTYSDARYEAKIGMPALTRLALTGAANGTVTGFKSVNGMDFDVAGASTLFGRLEAGDIRLAVSGGSTATLGGTGRNVTIETIGASRADLGDLQVENADANLAGASTGTVNVKSKLNANLSGASTLFYVGSPVLGTVRTADVSALRQK